MFADSWQQGYGTVDPIRTVMKSEKDENHKSYFVSEYRLSCQRGWRFREFLNMLDRTNRDFSRCSEDEEELEEDEEKSDTFIIDSLEDVSELVLVSLLPEITVFLVKIFFVSSPLMLSNSSSLT